MKLQDFNNIPVPHHSESKFEYVPASDACCVRLASSIYQTLKNKLQDLPWVDAYLDVPTMTNVRAAICKESEFIATGLVSTPMYVTDEAYLLTSDKDVLVLMREYLVDGLIEKANKIIQGADATLLPGDTKCLRAISDPTVGVIENHGLLKFYSNVRIYESGPVLERHLIDTSKQPAEVWLNRQLEKSV